MKDMNDHGMKTSYDCLDADMKLAKKSGMTASKRAGACFASVRDMLRDTDHNYHNDCMRYVKYYPWICTADRDVEGYMETVEQYLAVLFEIPFAKERIIEYTGYSSTEGRASEVDLEKYFLVDMKCPVDEGFAVLQMLRVPQEFPGQIKTFHETLKTTGCARTAFVTSLTFSNAAGSALAGGHAPTNGIDVKWAREFIKDPGYARSMANKWSSDIMGGAKRTSLRYKDFVKAITGEDPCTINVAVYGSLRRGMGNHGLLARAIGTGGATFLYSERVKLPVKMYSCGAYPALVPDAKTHGVYLEVFAVNKETLAQLDRLEGYPRLYDRAEMLVRETDLCWVYYMRQAPSEVVVETGNWKKFLEEIKRDERRTDATIY